MNRVHRIIFCLVLFAVTISCSSDDDNETAPLPCPVFNVSFIQDGEAVEFTQSGFGLSLRQDGYDLELYFGSTDNSNGVTSRNLSISVTYGATGTNVIDELAYSQNSNTGRISTDLVNESFQTEVLINSDTCFSATFSGSIDLGNEQVVITNGIMNVQYEESIAPITIATVL